MHLNKNASKNAGFTLVELIVVITILAILATIAFISYQGYTTDARNAKRNQDLNTIVSSIGARRAASAIPLSTLAADAVNVPSTAPSIAGATAIPTAGATQNYSAGKLNYTILGIKQSDFSDPDSLEAYRLGWTAKKTGNFELAAKLGGDTPKSIVQGNYVARTTALAATTLAGSSTGTAILAATEGAKFFVGDVVVGGGYSGAPVVTAVSSDLTRLTLSGATYSGTPGSGFQLVAVEGAGLIGTGTSTTALVTNNDSVNFPY